jgi:hypothetical protein
MMSGAYQSRCIKREKTWRVERDSREERQQKKEGWQKRRRMRWEVPMLGEKRGSRNEAERRVLEMGTDGCKEKGLSRRR